MTQNGPTTPSPAAEPRLAGVEWLRFLACLGIVGFHMQIPGKMWALGGLPAFMLLTVAFACRSAPSKTWREYAAARVRTLLVPWLFWSAALLVIPIFLTVSAGKPLRAAFAPWMLLAGPMIHLWFLPFALVVSLAIGGLLTRRSDAPPKAPGKWSWLFWLLLGCLTLVAAEAAFAHPPMMIATGPERCSWPEPFAQYLSVLACVPLGVGLAQIPAGDRRGWGRLALFGVLPGAICVAQAVVADCSNAIPNLVAVVACPLAWGITRRAGKRTLAWSRLSFGVYLLHPVVALVSYKLLVLTVSRDRTIDAGDRWLLALAVAAGALALTWILRKTWLKRVL